MSATSTVPIMKESIGWSIGISILMIVAGFLAILLPGAAGIAVNILVGWMLVFSGGLHFVLAWQTRNNGGLFLGLLFGILYFAIGGGFFLYYFFGVFFFLPFLPLFFFNI